MKTIFLFLITFFVVNGLKAQWFYQNSGTLLDLNSVHFLNSNSGYAVGDSGIILKTIDGGSNWTLKNSGTIQDLQSVYFCDVLTGFSVGDFGTILKTTDGGEYWSIVNVDPNPYLTSVYFPGDSCGYAVGYKTSTGMSCEAIIYKTIDGGDNWNKNFITEGLLHSVHFPSLNVGYAVGRMWGPGAYARTLKTIDGGLNWSVTDYSFSYGFVSVFFIEKDTGYCAGYQLYPYTSNTLFKTNNGGLIWSEQNVSHFNLISIYFINSDIGYGVGYNDWGGNGSIIKFTHGGQNWNCQDSTLPSMLNEIHFPNIDTGYIVGHNGIILKTINGGGPPVGLSDFQFQPKDISVFPNPVNEYLTLDCSGMKGNVDMIDIYNTFGAKVAAYRVNKTNSEITLDVQALPPGPYFLRLQAGNEVRTGKVIKY